MGEPATIFDSIDTLIRQGLGREKILELCDAAMFVRALGASDWNVRKAADLLQISKGRVEYWLKRPKDESIRNLLPQNLLTDAGAPAAQGGLILPRALSGTQTHSIWSGMIQRCTNPNTSSWHRYGGRGIEVCPRWREYANFLADMGERPPGMTIDRFPNNDGNYEPGNCRWATCKQQQQNRGKKVSPANGPK